MKGSMRRMVIDKMISEKGVVTFEELQDVLKVSSPTVKRDLFYMRTKLGYPIVYSHTRGGYYFEKAHPDLKGSKLGSKLAEQRVWYSSEELYSLVSMAEILGRLSKSPESALSTGLAPVRSRLLELLTLGETDPLELLRRVKVVSRRQVFEESACFQTVGIALTAQRRIAIDYFNPKRGDVTRREISPLRLVYSNSRWYIDAYCHLSDKLKTFLIENIRQADILEKAVRRVSLKDLAKELDSSYGMFRGKGVKTARIRFAKEVAPYVLREVWHEDQRVRTQEDGSIVLEVPYAGTTELAGEIMRWGSKVLSIEPAGLRRDVAAEVEHLAAVASKKGD